MANEKNLKPPWKPGQSGNPKGRSKKIMKRLEEAVGQEFNLDLTKTDKYQLVEWCLERTTGELEKICVDKKSPQFLKNIAKAILKDFKDGRINTVEAIFDRVFGRAIQGHAHLHQGGININVKFEENGKY